MIIKGDLVWIHNPTAEKLIYQEHIHLLAKVKFEEKQLVLSTYNPLSSIIVIQGEAFFPKFEKVKMIDRDGKENNRISHFQIDPIYSLSNVEINSRLLCKEWKLQDSDKDFIINSSTKSKVIVMNNKEMAKVNNGDMCKILE